MPYDYAPALCAAVLWALSAQFINVGLAGLQHREQDTIFSVAVALLTCLGCGFLVVWAISGFSNPLAALTPNVLMAGLLTFPIGTGLYYVCSIAYDEQAEIASQFANVKPAISIVLGAVVFHEAFTGRDLIVSALIAAGIAIIVISALRKSIPGVAVVLGMALALSWSAGEAFVAAETGGGSSLPITLSALFSSLTITAAAVAGYCVFRPAATRGHRATVRQLWPFAVHGVLSFGLAYMLYFQSIRTIGLARTIMITVAWPTLAVILRFALGRRDLFTTTPRTLLLAMALFALASFTFVWAR
jgi:drug/metabolite transporter (DMT)-like permease